MNQKEINELAAANQRKAHEVYASSGIPQVWEDAGCRVELIGSLKMGLLASHRDIGIDSGRTVWIRRDDGRVTNVSR